MTPPDDDRPKIQHSEKVFGEDGPAGPPPPQTKATTPREDEPLPIAESTAPAGMSPKIRSIGEKDKRHEDEWLRNEMQAHLTLLQRIGLITQWNDREIGAGVEWEDELSENLERADVILFLVSADFLASDYCYNVEMDRALQRHDSGEARAIPIILRSCIWKSAPFARLQVLPRSAKPVIEWDQRDSAWKDVAKGIKQAVEKLRIQREYL